MFNFENHFNFVRNLVLMLVFMLFSLVACTPSAPPPTPVARQESVVPETVCLSFDSDNNLSYAYSCVPTDTKTYVLKVKLVGEMANNTTTNYTTSGSYTQYSSGFGMGSFSGRMWQEGKGILPVYIISSSEETPWLNKAQPVIIKTVDLKIMGLPDGVYTTVICNHEIEVLSPIYSNQQLTNDRLTNEFDLCRMLDGTFSFGE